jgi:hypothetical protein
MVLLRAEGLLDEARIRELTVVFAGLGSLGSQTAAALPYGFGSVILADMDTLKTENVERHVLGHSDVGRAKVLAMADYLADRTLNRGRIETYNGRVEDILGECPDNTLVVVSVDGYSARAAINRVCYERNFPAMFGGVYPKGTGGDITVLPRPSEVCYLCGAWLTLVQTQGTQHTNYDVDPRAHSGQVEVPVPALKAPVGAVAMQMAISALELISGEKVPACTHRLIHTWQPVLTSSSPAGLPEAVDRFQAALMGAGVDPGWRNTPSSQGLTVDVRRSIVSFVINQWAGCPLHSTRVSLDEI